MKRLVAILLLLSVVFVGFTQTYPEKSNPPKLVNDYTGTLSTTQINTLENKLVAFDNKTSNQVAVVILPSLNGIDPADYGTELIRKWGIGNKENNGVLLLVAKDDRKISIVPGYGLEGALPDAICQSIIDNEIVPLFKKNDYYSGIEKGTDAIVKATEGTYTAPKGYEKRGKKEKKSGWSTFIFILMFILFILFSSRGGRGGGMVSRRGSIWWFPTGGGGFGSGGSSGGGGFGGFGGGSAGGGGASGSW